MTKKLNSKPNEMPNKKPKKIYSFNPFSLFPVLLCLRCVKYLRIFLFEIHLFIFLFRIKSLLLNKKMKFSLLVSFLCVLAVVNGMKIAPLLPGIKFYLLEKKNIKKK